MLHACGRRDHAEPARAASTRSARRRTTTCSPYIEPFADALAAADLAVARAGGSVLELAAAGLPSILVPYPHATRRPPDRATPATWSAPGAAVVVPDAELDGPRLAREVGALLGAPQRLAAMANAARAAPGPTPPTDRRELLGADRRARSRVWSRR